MLKPLVAEAPGAVITGCIHSGTTYIAKVLQASGVNAGHEAYFPRGWGGLDVDCSAPALFYLDRYQGKVWHQTRNPLKVVESIARTVAIGTSDGERLINAMKTYLDANLMAEKYASRRWRVEDIDSQIITDIVTSLGFTPDRNQIDLALNLVSKTSNAHVSGYSLLWGDLPDSLVKEKLINMGERYGY